MVFGTGPEVVNKNYPAFFVGQPVMKVSGYKFPGVVVAAFTNTKGEVRYVVEALPDGDFSGMLHIYNEQQLKTREV